MKKTILFILIALSIQQITAQETKLSRTDSVIFKAMRDEMDRSMKEYKHPEAGSFFYIMYQIDDGQNLSVSAELGSIIDCENKDFRSWGYRIMLGDYNCNDENFVSSSNDYDNSMSENINVPLGDDYIGIRRALWNMTEMSFESCVRSYIDKTTYFKENPLKKPAIPDFTKSDPVTSLKNSTVSMLEQKQAEDLVKKLSRVFRNYEKINESMVSFQQIKINIYMLSTEGAMCKIPMDYSIVSINAGIVNDSIPDNSHYESLSFYEENPAVFLTKIDQMIQSSKNLAEYVMSIDNLEEITENYTGPVILSDFASSRFFYNSLFGNEKKLFAERTPVYENSKYNFSQNKTTMEEKIGTTVIPDKFTVICKPKLTQFGNKNLFGSTSIDKDGIVPPEEIILIKDGKLKTLLHDRVPTDSIYLSNGHRRFGISNSSSVNMMAPSNLFVYYSGAKDKNALKLGLIDLCKENDLDYGIEIRSLDSTADESPYVYYKIDLAGKETRIKPLTYPRAGFKTLNKVKDCTTDMSTVNMMLGGNYSGMGYESGFNYGLNGCFISVIAPSSVLLKDIEITSKHRGMWE
jgi:hypothetical protein